MAQCEKERKKDGSESESRVQVAGFEHHIIIGFPFFKTDQWMCKLQEDINIFFWKCGNKKCCRNQAEIAVVLSDSLPYRRFNLISQHRHCTVQTRSSFFKLVGISLLRLYKNWAVEKSFIKHEGTFWTFLATTGTSETSMVVAIGFIDIMIQVSNNGKPTKSKGTIFGNATIGIDIASLHSVLRTNGKMK